MLLVYVEAPFATFRTFTAGWYRPTATFLTPSAAYGLLLNAAGIDSRLREGDDGHDGKTPASLTRTGLPAMDLAVGAAAFRLRGKDSREDVPAAEVFPRVQSVYQQLHNYPVGASGAERAESTKGNKYNITPVRREFLTGLRAVIAVKADADTEGRILAGFGADPPGPRYGVPFLGDNAFLLDRMEVLETPGPVRWFEKVTAAGDSGPRERTTRLTVLIDRADLSRTTSALFAPCENAELEPTTDSWVGIEPPRPPALPPVLTAVRGRGSKTAGVSCHNPAGRWPLTG